MSSSASWFGGVETAPAIEVFALTLAFNEDKHSQKVNLGVGGSSLFLTLPYFFLIYSFRCYILYIAFYLKCGGDII